MLRGVLLSLTGLGISFPLSGFPEIHRAPWLIVPALMTLWGSYETSRCLRPRWDFYHGGVLLLLYSDLMALLMIFFLLFYPYAQWLL